MHFRNLIFVQCSPMLTIFFRNVSILTVSLSTMKKLVFDTKKTQEPDTVVSLRELLSHLETTQAQVLRHCLYTCGNQTVLCIHRDVSKAREGKVCESLNLLNVLMLAPGFVLLLGLVRHVAPVLVHFDNLIMLLQRVDRIACEIELVERARKLVLCSRK